MRERRRKVVCIHSDASFLGEQKIRLDKKRLQKYFFPFSDFKNSLYFIEKQIVTNRKKLHYILVDEKNLESQLAGLFKKISGFYTFLNDLEIIVCTDKNSDELRNSVLEYPIVSTILVNPIPENYIEFLITGKSGE